MFDSFLGEGMTAIYSSAIYTTLKITLISTLLAYLIGTPLGVLLYCTDKDGIFPNKAVNTIIGFIVNVLRSVPFMILLVMTQPLARALVGTSIGDNAFIVYLLLAAAPFVARMVESSFKEVDRGVIEAAQSMGSGNFQIIWKVLLPESKPSAAYRRRYRTDDNSRVHAYGAARRGRRSRTARYPVRSLPLQQQGDVHFVPASHNPRADNAGGPEPGRQSVRQTHQEQVTSNPVIRRYYKKRRLYHEKDSGTHSRCRAFSFRRRYPAAQRLPTTRPSPSRRRLPLTRRFSNSANP